LDNEYVRINRGLLPNECLKIDATSTRQFQLGLSGVHVEVPKINNNSECILVLTVEI